MNHPSDLIDVSTWTGNWPFIHLNNRTLPELQHKLSSLGIVRAFVSPFEGVLEQDPMRANVQLLEDIHDDFFSPVPIIDLSYANWEEMIERAGEDGRVQMIKLLPNYHMYELNRRQLEKVVNVAKSYDLVISVQIRMEDPRGQYPLMKVPCVDVKTLSQTVLAFPEQKFIFHNLFLNELASVLGVADHVYVELSSLEHMDILKFIRDRYTLDHVLFSTHAPFYFPEGNVYKLKYSELSKDEIDLVGRRNVGKLLGE